jgi:putative phosphoribosyl transferase
VTRGHRHDPPEGVTPRLRSALADPALFCDREEAGSLLADALADRGLDDAICVGLARGGIVPAWEIARRLALPLDVLAVRKVGYPGQPEYAIGAVTPCGGRVLRDVGHIPEEMVESAVIVAQRRAEELDDKLHREHPALSPAGKAVLLVDDGLATGTTMVAAIRWARRAGATSVVVAVPVGPPETAAALEAEADEVVCLERPALFGAVGFWYEDFAEVTDERVREVLAAARLDDGVMQEARP